MAATASASASENNVELGFAEENFSWKLTSKYFPSKIGGKPAWLDLKNLPTSKQLSCPKCEKQCVFLLQIYAPVNDRDDCFHRSIMLFICKNPNCSKKNRNENILVFRSQLARKNECYDFEPYEEDENDPNPSAEKYKSMCYVCGCPGPLRCSRCHVKQYCSLEHQKIDWKAGHNKECKSLVKQDGAAVQSTGWKIFLLPEYEIVMEEEPKPEDRPKKSEVDVLTEYKMFLASEKAHSILPENSDSNDVLEELANKEDKMFKRFLQKTQIEPQQVLRYHKNCDPLWITLDNMPKEDDIPKCQCGAERKFEFQVMPQVLNHLKLDNLDESIDWGVLAVYTCSANCNDGSAYHPEFVWKQDI